MEASFTEQQNSPIHQQISGYTQSDGGSVAQTRKQVFQRPVNGQNESCKPSGQDSAEKLGPTTDDFQKGNTSNGHGQGARCLTDVSRGIVRDGGNYWANGVDCNSFKGSDAMILSGTLSGTPFLRQHATRPDSPVDGPAPLSTRRSSSGSNYPPSLKHLKATHGSHRLQSGPGIQSSHSKHRHSHGGVSNLDGGYFVPRSHPQPFPLRLFRGNVTPPHSGAAVVTSVAAASTHPYPGRFIRYVIVPLMLLPLAWPWLLLRSAQAMLGMVCVMATVMVDGLILLADLLRRNRANMEVLITWAAGWLAWVVAYYWAVLGQLHMGCEDFLSRLSLLLTPLLASALSRSPAVARIFRLISPVFLVVAKTQASVYGAYCFVHDEIVPVALDLAERLPLVHWLLHRAVEGGSA